MGISLNSLLVSKQTRAFTGVGVIAFTALADVIALGCFLGISYQTASTADTAMDAKVWKLTDAVFCVSLLYLMMASGGYRRATLRNPFSQISRILVNGCAIVSLEWLALWAVDLNDIFEWPLYGPLNIVSFGVFLMCIFRLITFWMLESFARKGVISRRIAIVGAGIHGQRLLDALRQRKEVWTQIVGVFDDRISRYARSFPNFDALGSVDDLITYSRSNRIDEIVVALPWGAEDRLLGILGKLKVIPANVRLAPDVIGHHFLDRGFEQVDGIPLYNIYRRPISGWSALLKRAEDMVLGSLILMIVAPVMIICAAAIKIDSRGPIFFRQNRFGYNNELIGVYKFRSMYNEMRDESASRLTTQNDPRVTRVGNFLRRTSLDELPQLLNVIRGEMSLVGPRPHAVQAKAAGKLYQEVVAEYALRHKVKPGITGWAQVMGWRGETDTELKIRRRVECDLYYMEHWSLFLDIEIIFRTIPAMIGKNVY